ncbi:leucyl aminopeptidase [Buchnera aphidicola]|uniref:Probable cytosol aminopeptidase n=1 Tax=Buchnera aphidicola (Aphis gossypii) TaxID=98785 RepID=A0A5J6ZD62_9GAMM|nr:leucyl aminopeptidase [Buchnera aphidicola]QFQ32189.1 leucyl aminopeptidase [Buchnera aphidicola (Aphis gossypii)]UPT14715.1 leucyl aminopeptidase [Buchnera aphidicola (Aphis gossypii)]
MNFFLENFDLNVVQTDCIVVGIFKSLELTSSADILNKYSNDYISKLIHQGDINGEIGTNLLLYNVPNIISKRILLVGCGEKNNFKLCFLTKIIKNAIPVLNKSSIQHVFFSLNELYFCKNQTYWFIRKIISDIHKKIFKITTFFKKEIYLKSITFNIKDKNLLLSAQTALKHAKAISLGLTAAKKISNLPPNICNPLYLSLEAKKLSHTYKDNIEVTTIDSEKMKILGMHAYLAVGNGSKNKPYMSVIKYSKKNTFNKKVIVLIGKGLTFDSGGISIKPSQNMHEMKYDMCGAAAVYGALITAAELNLPLNVIGVLAGCENMPGGSSFRPGDVLNTMSGKTVEVLNTDAEGRLVLCDVFKYVERFSPNIVIDVATLTGACVTALGHYVTGLFSNNEILTNDLKKAAQQTDDKVWQLPLFDEYAQDIKSNIAHFSNVGNQGAGAITAAFFLSQFTKKYYWAHLDIAGTAWESGMNKGSTGRPVELLSQFLLNISNLNEC